MDSNRKGRVVDTYNCMISSMFMSALTMLSVNQETKCVAQF